MFAEKTKRANKNCEIKENNLRFENSLNIGAKW
jgi:hypothetical protein